MQNLPQLIAAGFSQGRDGASGMDSTVSSLQWALANIGSTGTALCYATCAADSLEARLIAAYAIECVAHLKGGDTVRANAAYNRARQVQELSTSGTTSGGAHGDSVESVLAEIGQMFEQRVQRLDLAA